MSVGNLLKTCLPKIKQQLKELNLFLKYEAANVHELRSQIISIRACQRSIPRRVTRVSIIEMIIIKQPTLLEFKQLINKKLDS